VHRHGLACRLFLRVSCQATINLRYAEWYACFTVWSIRRGTPDALRLPSIYLKIQSLYASSLGPWEVVPAGSAGYAAPPYNKLKLWHSVGTTTHQQRVVKVTQVF